jgi:DNA-binding CsgD family transcriptional regulator
MQDEELLGRDPEGEAIARLLENAPRRGGALVVHGEAGIGKSALLAVATLTATAQGMTVVRTSGVRSETDLPFAGLHQLLQPWLGQLDGLPSLQREALYSAFGISQSTGPQLFTIALAALNLLSEAAGPTPLALVVEDAHWLDRPTADVLTFVGRRLESDRIALLIAIRDGYRSPLLDAGLPELRLGRLSEQTARQLLQRQFPDLGSDLRRRVLEAAEGNPLALLELPLRLASSRGMVGPLMPLPLTARVEAAFASRVVELPAATRRLLLLAAADERANMAEVIAAAQTALGERPAVEDLVPATDAKLLEIDGAELRFRHPLVSSAIYQTATVAERHAAHAALADVLRDPDRQVWHRAAATVGVNAEVALELEETASRAQRRGANAVAAAAFERAAAITVDPRERARLLLGAAEAAAELGRTDMVLRVLSEARSMELGTREAARATLLEDWFRSGPVGDRIRVGALVRAARDMIREGDIDLALGLVASAAFRCYVGDLDEDCIGSVLAIADLIEVSPDDARLLQIVGYAAPVQRGAAIIKLLPEVSSVADPMALSLLGTAASQAGALEQAALLLDASVSQLRDQGRLRPLAEALLHQAWAAIRVADFGLAAPAAAEAVRLAEETGQLALEPAAWAAQAFLAALRGERAVVDELTESIERFSLQAAATSSLALAQWARGVAAIGAGQHGAAYDHLARLYEAGDPARHHQIGCHVIGDFVEAAVRSGHSTHAAAVLGEIEPVAVMTPSPVFHGSLRYARALLADDTEAEGRFLEAMAHKQAVTPFLRARLQLALGEWLRRRRRVADARSPLRAARDSFDVLGVRPWGERAREQLRAAGETSRRYTPDALEQLTPQELQIVQMAAEGLSNRQVGQRLYLSHRTVESHLHRVFPKLGISSRNQLAEALSRRASTSA